MSHAADHPVVADELATLTTLGAYGEIIGGLIARHQGRVFDTGGGRVPAEFGGGVLGAARRAKAGKSPADRRPDR